MITDGHTPDKGSILTMSFNHILHKIISPLSFLSSWRSLPWYELVSYQLMFASVPMLAYGIQAYTLEMVEIILLTILTLNTGFFSALIWNDITDADIDAIVHPDRPLPSGKIQKNTFFAIAVFFAILMCIFAVLISIPCLLLVSITALFVSIHNKILRRKINIPAYSEIVTPLQWVIVVIFGYCAVWTTTSAVQEIYTVILPYGHSNSSFTMLFGMIFLCLFTYFADSAHDIVEGIHDYLGDKTYGVKTYATSFGAKKAGIISIVMLFLSAVFAFGAFFLTSLSYIFLIGFIAIFLYTTLFSIRFYRSHDLIKKNKGLLLGRKIYDYFLLTFVLIFLDIFIQLIFFIG